MTTMARRVTAVLAVLATALFLSSCATSTSDGHSDHPSTDEPVITGQPASHNDADVAFATNMIPHHQQAVDLAALVPDRTKNADVIALANQISAAQQPEINVMRVFLVQWTDGGASPDGNAAHAGHDGPMHGMVDQATMDKLKSLNGPDFDRLWLESMIGHHEGAIEMAKAEIANGDNMDAKKMAQDIVTTQDAEIGQMKQLLGG